MVKRHGFLVLAATTLLGGCQTLDIDGGVREVITEPAGALLTIDGVGSCQTPCTIKLDGPQTARIAKAGFITVTLTLEAGRSALVIPLELAAASEDVDAIALPELD